MKKEIKISFVIVARDEEKMIGGCLRSLKWADEVIVINHGSEDKTKKIAQQFGAKVFDLSREKRVNYSRPRNEGLKRALGEWIFYIDADERVSQELRKELQEMDLDSESEKHTWFAVPRMNVILGKPMKHGGWWPDYVKRLFKKSSLSKWRGELHEEPVVEGMMGKLKSPLRHEKHETVFEMLEKTNEWSEIEGKLMFESNHPPMNIVRFCSAMAREFWYRMIKKMAFLDGPKGIIMAMYQVYSRFISYAKLWEMQISKK